MTRKSTLQRSGAASAQQVANHLDMTRQRVGQYEHEGTFRRKANGKFDLDECRIALIRRLREQRQAVQTPERQRLDDARARQLELRNAEVEHRLVDIEEALAACDEVIGLVKAGLAGVPARVGRDLATRRHIEDALADVMSRLAKQFAARADELRTTGHLKEQR